MVEMGTPEFSFEWLVVVSSEVLLNSRYDLSG